MYAFAVGEWRSETAVDVGAWTQLRGCGRGRSVKSRAGSEAMRDARVGGRRVRCRPCVSDREYSKMRRGQEAPPLLPASPRHALDSGRNGRRTTDDTIRARGHSQYRKIRSVRHALRSKTDQFSKQCSLLQLRFRSRLLKHTRTCASIRCTDPHSGHIWCSTYPVHCTEPRSVVMQKTKGNPMRTDGTAGRRYTTGRESALGPVTVAPTRPSGEWTGSPHSTLPSRSTRQEGRNAGNDWLNSVARRGHQSGSDVNSTLYRLGPGRHDSIRFKQTENPILRSPKEYNPTADVRMDVGVRGGASGGFGVGGLR